MYKMILFQKKFFLNIIIYIYSHGENTVTPTKKRQTNSDPQTLWLGPIEQQRYKR